MKINIYCYCKFYIFLDAKLAYILEQIFDKNWHKIDIGAFKDRLVIYIDCEYVGTQDVKPWGPIKVDGEISISKMSLSKLTVPVSSIIHF